MRIQRLYKPMLRAIIGVVVVVSTMDVLTAQQSLAPGPPDAAEKREQPASPTEKRKDPVPTRTFRDVLKVEVKG